MKIVLFGFAFPEYLHVYFCKRNTPPTPQHTHLKRSTLTDRYLYSSVVLFEQFFMSVAYNVIPDKYMVMSVTYIVKLGNV